ncbi:MAG TPA: glycosyltransferase family 1 protein [Candidatus Acidoferrum sp.]|nr:glycosyltransferase family 1 protein [Candidatus Acidoferrum sp.]
MRVLLNAVSAKMGGAANYINNLAVELALSGSEHEFIFLAPEAQAKSIRGLTPNVHVVVTDVGDAGIGARLWFDNVTLRRLVRREKIDVLFSTANFAMFCCPCRQVLLIRNALHFSPMYPRKLRRTMSRRLENSLRRRLICRSAKAADIVMTPSQSMLDDLRLWCCVPYEKSLVNYYGVNAPLLQATRRPSGNGSSRLPSRLLYTSLYAEHKNVTTLLRALLELIRSGTVCHLVTTADPNWAQARWTSTWKEDALLAASPELFQYLEFRSPSTVEETAALYGGADVFVYPSAVESFGHPLVEAMTVGLPIVAADAPVNRELCRDAAIYFSPFDPKGFAQQIRRVMEDSQLRLSLIDAGLRRSREFSWKRHAQILINTFNQLSSGAMTLEEAKR